MPIRNAINPCPPFCKQGSLLQCRMNEGVQTSDKGLRGTKCMHSRSWVCFVVSFSMMVEFTCLVPCVSAANDPSGLGVRRSRQTGLAVFVTAKPGGVIGVSTAPGKVKADADDFLRVHGYLFGIVDPVKQLVQRKTFTDSLQTTHASFEQVHKGVPVFSGVIRLHQNGAGDFTVANGDFYPIPNEFVVIPQLSSDAATAKARGWHCNSVR